MADCCENPTKRAKLANDGPGHAVVSKEEWLEARKELLKEEKKLALAYQALAAKRRELPWTIVDEDYVFTTTAGEERKLSELFGDKKHLVVHFYMFDDEWDKPCAFCSFWLDGWSSQLVHLEKKMSFVAIAKAGPPKIKALQKSKGWPFQMLSSHENTFSKDFGSEFSQDELFGPKVYNYGTTPAYAKQCFGLHSFVKGEGEAAGKIFHTYSTYARGIELANVVLTLLDMTPMNRFDGPEKFDQWVKHKEEY